jgi:protein-tyrosine phosphatase
MSDSVSLVVTAVLRHPWMMSVKRTLRNVKWAVSGRGTSNPPIPANLRSVLFVCLGNICRSPFAGASAARQLANRNDLAVKVRSAGIKTSQGARSPVDACEAASRFGVSLTEHRPVLLTNALMADSDLVVVMEPSQAEALRAAYPESAATIVLLSLFDDRARGFDRFHVEDPFMRPLGEFVACYERIDRAVANLLAAIAAAKLASKSPQ